MNDASIVLPRAAPVENPAPCHVSITLNGTATQLLLQHPTQTLMRALQGVGLRGTKEGCGDGDCGACTVAIERHCADGSTRIEAVNSCLVPAMQLQHCRITSVEGVAQKTQPHPVQQAMMACHGSQCGYCTPGFIMSMYAGFENAALSEASVEGNLCRCTGYTSIRRAIQSLQAAPIKTALAVGDGPCPATASNSWHFPSSIAEALALKAQLPGSTWVAGATDLGLDFSHQRRPFAALISLHQIEALQQLEQTDAGYFIGAGVSLSDIKTQMHGAFAALDTMLHWFAAMQVRNRATLGGNLGTASPIGDLLPVLLALNAQIDIASHSGVRRESAQGFFQGYRKTALASDELITGVFIPRANATTHLTQSYKVGKRGSDDISIVAASFALELDRNNIICAARLAYGGVAAVPARALRAEAALVGKPFTPDGAQAALAALPGTFTPMSDFRASQAYRETLIVNLLAKFFALGGAP
jgi:xanthine dehydrogenase small subunit